jgi:RNA polymerase sigma factor (sigma-70 family)
MIIPAIGKQKISYKDHSKVEFESLDFYLNLAQKIIAKMAPTFFNGLSKEMLKSEDAIAFVANAIMMGDWRWEKDHKEESKSNKGLYSYRNQCAIWAIQTYVTKQYKTKNSKKKITPQYSLNYQDNDLQLENIIADKTQQDPSDILSNMEQQNIQHKLINDLFDSEIISDKQKEYIRSYYFDNMTLEKIGKKNNITREAVRQSIKSAIAKIRKLVNE